MSEEKLQNLVKEFPEYSGVFNAILDWFKTNPKMNAISMDIIYSNKFGFTKTEISIAFSIMKHKNVLKTIYRVIDEEGYKIGKDFNAVDEIPETVDSILGEKKAVKDIFVVPFYSLNI